MTDYVGTGRTQFSCALVQMRYSIEENNCGHILGAVGGGGALAGTEWKKGKSEESRKGEKGVGICTKQ